MASNQHRNLTGEQLHNPKGFDGASPSTTLTKNAAGEIQWVSNSNFDNALDYVSPQSAPPTEVEDDIYLLDDTGVVYDIDTIAWQSGNTIRYTFNGTPNLSAITAGDYLVTSGNGNSSNDGTFVISAVNDGSDYIEITNALRSDATDDEASDAVGTAYYTLEEWDGASKGSHIKFDGTNWNSVNAQDGALCYDETSSSHRIYNATSTNWDLSLTTVSGAGVAQISGTPNDNEIAVWTNSTTIEGDSNFTWNGTNLEVKSGNEYSRVTPDVLYNLSETDSANLTLYTIDTAADTGSIIELGRYNGAVGGQLPLADGDLLAATKIRGSYDAANPSLLHTSILIETRASGAWTTSNRGAIYTIDTVANGSAASFERFRIDSDGSIKFNDAYKFPTADGSANQVLKTNGTGALTFQDESGVTATSGTATRVAVFDGTDSIEGDANFTWSGSQLNVNGKTIIKNSGLTSQLELHRTGSSLIYFYDDAGSAIQSYIGDATVATTADTFRIFHQGSIAVDIDSSQNVDIPNGTLTVGDSGSDTQFKLKRSSTNLMKFQTAAGVDRAYIGMDSAGDLSMYHYDSSKDFNVYTGGQKALEIDNNQNVNILEGNLASTFDVSYPIRIQNDRQNTSYTFVDSTGATVRAILGYGQVTVGGSPTDSFNIQNNENSPMRFYTNSQERVQITAAGNVGIGETSPQAKLHASDSGEIFRLETSAGTGDNYMTFHDTAQKGLVGYESGSDNLIIENGEIGSSIIFKTAHGGGGGTTYEGLKLDGGGDVTVTGNLICNSDATARQFYTDVTTYSPTGASPSVAPNFNTDGSVIIIDCSGVTSGNVTIDLSSASQIAGASYLFKLIQGSNNTSIVFPSVVKFAGETAPYTHVLTTASGAIDVVAMTCISDSGTVEYLANVSQNYG
jgi:hypothetical protein